MQPRQTRRGRAADELEPRARPALGYLTLAAAALGLTMAALACGPIVKPAAFRQRPESVQWGLPLGPFEGRVVDADSGKPLEGAAVSCSWTFYRGVGVAVPELSRTESVVTDADGAYRVRGVDELPGGLSSRLGYLTIAIHRPGYVAYRHDLEFDPRRPRVDFFQYGNTARLRRWSPELSHARHLLFIGGAVRPALVRDDLVQASAELDRRLELERESSPAAAVPSERAGGQRAGAALLLRVDDVRQLTGYQGSFEVRALADAGDAADSLHLRAIGQPERYDVALRLWRLGGDELLAKFEALREALPGSDPLDDLGDRAFVVTQGEILGLALMDSGQAALVLMTCGRAQCSSLQTMQRMGALIAGRLDRLPKLEQEASEQPQESNALEDPFTQPDER